MGFLKQRKNKRYSYQPRYYKGEGSPFELKHKFDDFRKTVNPSSGIKGKFNDAVEDYKSNPDDTANRRVIIIIAVLILLFLFIIEFDLSIFYKS